MTWWAHLGDAHYHGLQTMFKAKVKRMLFNFTYTYSHSIGNLPMDESGGTAGIQTLTWAGNPSLDKGNTQINRPHMFVGNLVIPLPELNGSNPWVRGVAGGWQVGAITMAQSGPSTTITQPGLSENTAALVDPSMALGLNSLYGTGNNGPPWHPGENRRPDVVPGVSCTSGRHGPQIYNPAAFTVIGHVIGTIGNEPTGFCQGPRFVNTDFSLQKNWKVGERVSLQFRLDAFNLFNHPNFQPNYNQYSPPIGSVNCGAADGNGLYQPCSPINNLITAATPGGNLQATAIVANNDREIQYGFRITF
ncbi:MAG TPA: hypothetical protein VFI95_11170 [Terriglobales bacterium]|nr:hypothetical protein [Terriglobales bacterium]